MERDIKEARGSREGMERAREGTGQRGIVFG